MPLAPVNCIFLKVPRGCPRPKGPRKPVFRVFPSVRVHSAKAQNIKKLRNAGEKLSGRTDFPPKSAPNSGKLCFSVFGPEFLQVPRGFPRPKGLRKPVFHDFPSVGVRSAKTQNVKNLRNFGGKLLGERIFFPKVPLTLGNCVFPFSARNFSKCQGATLGQKGLETQYFAICRPWGSARPKRKK